MNATGRRWRATRDLRMFFTTEGTEMRGAPRAQPKKLTTVSHAPGRTQVHENTIPLGYFRDRNAEVVPGRTRASCVPAPTLSTLEACAPRDARALSAFA